MCTTYTLHNHYAFVLYSIIFFLSGLYVGIRMSTGKRVVVIVIVVAAIVITVAAVPSKSIKISIAHQQHKMVSRANKSRAHLIMMIVNAGDGESME